MADTAPVKGRSMLRWATISELIGPQRVEQIQEMAYGKLVKRIPPTIRKADMAKLIGDDRAAELWELAAGHAINGQKRVIPVRPAEINAAIHIAQAPFETPTPGVRPMNVIRRYFAESPRAANSFVRYAMDLKRRYGYSQDTEVPADGRAEGASRATLDGATNPTPRQLTNPRINWPEQKALCNGCGEWKHFDLQDTKSSDFWIQNGAPTSKCKTCVRAAQKVYERKSRAKRNAEAPGESRLVGVA